MNKSESIKELASALCKAQSEMKGAQKDSVNPFFKSKYADLSSVWDAARPVLAANGLSVSQLVDRADGGNIGLTTLLLHSSGEWLESKATIPMKDGTAQAAGSAITYLRRYALAAILGVVADEDDDGNAASQKRNQERHEEAGRGMANNSITKNLKGRWDAIVAEAKAAGVKMEFGIGEDDNADTLTERAGMIKAAIAKAGK